MEQKYDPMMTLAVRGTWVGYMPTHPSERSLCVANPIPIVHTHQTLSALCCPARNVKYFQLARREIVNYAPPTCSLRHQARSLCLYPPLLFSHLISAHFPLRISSDCMWFAPLIANPQPFVFSAFEGVKMMRPNIWKY